MRTVQKIQTTYDGKVHDDKKSAMKHLEARYADILLPMANKMLTMNVTQHAEFIDQNLDKFALLIEIKADMTTMEEE